MLDFLAHAVDSAFLLEHGERPAAFENTHPGVLLASPILAHDHRITFILPDDEFMAVTDELIAAGAWPTTYGEAAARWMELD